MDTASQLDEKSIGGLVQKGTRILSDAGIENAAGEARVLMAEYMHKDITWLYSRLEDHPDDITAMRYLRSIKKRATHYPFQYIVGYTYFMDLLFTCKENVLIPRFDTENLVMHALEVSKDKDMNVLDLCTGSGCIGISYELWRRREFYHDNVVLADISPHAISLAAENRDRLHSRADIVESDLFSAFRDDNGEASRTFDMILSNPPYIRTKDIYNLMKDVRDYEPRLALDGQSDGLYFYRRIISESVDFLADGGYLILEIGSEQYMDVSTLMRAAGFHSITKLKDMSGLDRVVSGVLRK